MSARSWAYFGLLDDMAIKYRWKFTVDRAFLEHLLIVEMLHGKPVLLNDGYLVQNEYLQQSIVQKRGLVWELMQSGFVGVMNRGLALPEMPERMAKHVDSMRVLINRSDQEMPWRRLRAGLADLDRHLNDRQLYVGWPKFHSGSGYELLARRLLDRNATPHSLGIGRHVSKTAFSDFLKAFLDRLAESNLEAPRTQWEKVAIEFGDDARYTNRPTEFVRAMMNLANEIYHYNIGIMLAADGDKRISVQTQTSPAFDDILFPPGLKVLVRDITNAPRLYVPKSVATIDPKILVTVLEPGSRAGLARERWMALRNSWENSDPINRPKVESDLRQASSDYSRELTSLLGSHVRYREPERLIDYALGEVSLAAIGAAAGGLPGGMAGFALGYGISRFKDRIAGSVVRKFRVEVFRNELRIPLEVAEYSQRVVTAIKRRGVPSSIELPPGIASTFASRLKPFGAA